MRLLCFSSLSNLCTKKKKQKTLILISSTCLRFNLSTANFSSIEIKQNLFMQSNAKQSTHTQHTHATTQRREYYMLNSWMNLSNEKKWKNFIILILLWTHNYVKNMFNLLNDVREEKKRCTGDDIDRFRMQNSNCFPPVFFSIVVVVAICATRHTHSFII